MAHANPPEGFAGTHKLPLRQTALGVFGAAVAVGHGMTLLEKSHHSKKPDITMREHAGEQAIFVLPGCRTDGRYIADLLEPQLSKLGTTIFMAYPQNGFSLDAIGRGLVQAREQAGKKRASVYAISMGGLVLSRLGADEAFRRDFGAIDTLVLDSSPARSEDIKPKMQRLLTAARIARYSFAMGKITPAIMAHLERGELADHEPGIDDALVRQHFDTSAQMPLYTIASQGDFMHRQRGLSAGALSGWVHDIYYVRSSNDSVIDTDSSLLAYSAAFGQPIVDVVDEQRPSSSHAVGPEYPSGLIEFFQRSQLIAA